MTTSTPQQQAEETIRLMHPLARLQPELEKPFGPDQEKTLPGPRGMILTYIDARDVAERLDQVVGPHNWSARYESIGPLNEHGVQCHLTVLDVTKAGLGYPNGQDEEGEPLKAAESDALKRAAVAFGIGRYLYRLNKSSRRDPDDGSDQIDRQGDSKVFRGGAEASDAQLKLINQRAYRLKIKIDVADLSKSEASDLLDDLTANQIPNNPRVSRADGMADPRDDGMPF
jgi:hypothetical protein